MFKYIGRFFGYFNSHIRFKIILPFAFLTIMVAIAGIYLTTRLIAGSLEERFTRQLLDTGEAANDGLFQQEQLHLQALRSIAFTTGIDEAVPTGDHVRLQELLFPLVVNYGVDRVDIVRSDGVHLLGYHRKPGTDTVDYMKSGFLFSVGLEFQGDLEAGELSPDFRKAFESNSITLFDDLTIEPHAESDKWRIKENGTGQMYVVSREGETLNIYTSGGVELGAGPERSAVQKVLSGFVDSQGDKFVVFTTIDGNEVLLTAGPLKRGEDVVGAILVSSYTDDLLRSLKESTFANGVSVYDIDGNLVNTTFGKGEEVSNAVAISPNEIRALLALEENSIPRRAVSVSGQEYDMLFRIFYARGKPFGFYSVALSTTTIVSYGTAARSQLALIFAAALLLVFGIGYLAANTITGRLQHLMENAMAVADGDFSRRTQSSSGDEIGLLARSLDHMTASLAQYTSDLKTRIEELTALYKSSTAVTVESGLNLDHVLQAVIASVKEAIRGTDQVFVHLLDESRQILNLAASTSGQANGFPSLSFAEADMRHLLATVKPQAMQLSDFEAYALDSRAVSCGAGSDRNVDTCSRPRLSAGRFVK
jgi:HAMP domain-containing protein